MDQLNKSYFGRWISTSKVKHLRIVEKVFNIIEGNSENSTYDQVIKMSDLVSTNISPIPSVVNSNEEQDEIATSINNSNNTKKLRKNVNFSTSTIITQPLKVKIKTVDVSPKLQKALVIQINSASQDQTNIANSAVTELDVQDLANKSTNYPPIMGKNALLSKCNRTQYNQDHRIVHSLVHDRFRVNMFESRPTANNISIPSKKCKHIKFEDDFKNNVSEDNNDNWNALDTSNASSAFNTSYIYSEELSNLESLDTIGALEELDNCIAVHEDSGRSTANTSDASGLISKNSSNFSSTSRHVRSLSLHTCPEENSEISLSSASSNVAESTTNEYKLCYGSTDAVTYLLQESGIQLETMRQASKALSICQRMKEFFGSEEHIECERLLLLSSNKRKALKDEISLLENEDNKDIGAICGDVNISNIQFTINEPLDIDESNLIHKKICVYKYVCILASGVTVFATKVQTTNTSGEINFEECFKFQELPPDFEILLSIYVLRHQSKFPLNKTKNLCGSPQNLLKKNNSLRWKWLKFDNMDIKNSSFSLLGTVSVNIHNAKKHISSWKLRLNSSSSTYPVLSDKVYMNIHTSVILSSKQSGFLTIGHECGGGVSWGRKWCVLDNACLKYWNSPSEEDVSSPVGIIQLNRCASSWIALADRSLCPRPRTLLLEIYKMPKLNIRHSSIISNEELVVKYFLFADNISEMNLWQKELNSVISALRNWHCMQVNI